MILLARLASSGFSDSGSLDLLELCPVVELLGVPHARVGEGLLLDDEQDPHGDPPAPRARPPLPVRQVVRPRERDEQGDAAGVARDVERSEHLERDVEAEEVQGVDEDHGRRVEHRVEGRQEQQHRRLRVRVDSGLLREGGFLQDAQDLRDD